MDKDQVVGGLALIIADVSAGKIGKQKVVNRMRTIALAILSDAKRPADPTGKAQAKEAPKNPPAAREAALPSGVAKGAKGRTVSKEHTDAFKEVWEYWKVATDKPRSQPSTARKKCVIARLKAGFSVDEIKRAVDGALSSEHHTEGDYLDLTLICRNTEKLEWFRDKGGKVPAITVGATRTSKRARELAKIEEKSMEALNKGDMVKYEKLQARAEVLRGSSDE